jgi:hypothetical protein
MPRTMIGQDLCVGPAEIETDGSSGREHQRRMEVDYTGFEKMPPVTNDAESFS